MASMSGQPIPAMKPTGRAGKIYSSVALKRRKKRQALADAGIISSGNVNELKPREIDYLRSQGLLPGHQEQVLKVAKRRAAASNAKPVTAPPVPGLAGQLSNVSGVKRKRKTSVYGRGFGA